MWLSYWEKKSPLEFAKMTETHLQCDNMGDVLKSFMRWKSFFTTENEKGATERNEILKLHKSKDWLKLVTYWVKTVTITHTRTNSSTVTHLLSMLGWDMTVPTTVETSLSCKAGVLPFPGALCTGWCHLPKAARETGNLSHQPAAAHWTELWTPTCICA